MSMLDIAPMMPVAPKRMEDAGISGDLILQLVTKTLHFAGDLRGIELAARLGVPFPVIEPALELLKAERHCEIVGGSMVGAPAFVYRLTDAGRIRAALFLEDNHYVGALPVPLEQYQAAVAASPKDTPTAVAADTRILCRGRMLGTVLISLVFSVMPACCI